MDTPVSLDVYEVSASEDLPANQDPSLDTGSE